MSKPTKFWVPTTEHAAGQSSCMIQLYPVGAGAGACYLLRGQPAFLGRDPESDIRINEVSVSRRHARVEPEGEEYFLHDLGSTNGTYVNDVRVMSQKLHDGDLLHIGNAIFRFLSGNNIEAAYHEEIYRLAIIDALTGVPNHRYFMEFVERELVRSERHKRPLVLAMLDIDHFKSINDRYGHLAGDFALRELAGCVNEMVRNEDLFARYGGEEFAWVLPETEFEVVKQLVEELRKRIDERGFHFDQDTFHMTVSLGLTSVCGEDIESAEFIRRADEKLYQAKNSGRNKVVW